MIALRTPSLARTGAVLALVVLGGCNSSWLPWNGDEKKLEPKLNASQTPVEEVYNHGVDALNQKRYATATEQFDLVEQDYPYSSWAVNAQLMSGYSLYLQNRYTDAIGTLDRFIQLHPAHRDVAYAYYLRALCYYEQIPDIQRDQKSTQLAMTALQEVVNRFP